MPSRRILSTLVFIWLQLLGCAVAFVLLAPPIAQTSSTSRRSSRHNLAGASDDQDFGLQRIKMGGDQEFWAKQKELAEEMTDMVTKSKKQEQSEKFEKRRLALVGDTAYISFLIFCALWAVYDNPLTALSYSVGAAMGLAYTYGLGKSVETMGASIDDTEQMQGAGVGEARFAFLILLFVIVGKFRGDGLQEIPSISGFFTYQLASLNQGLREIND